MMIDVEIALHEPEPLDERALRRPGHRGDVAVTLADGQAWMLRRPRPVWVADPAEGARPGYDLGPAYDALIRGADAAADAGGDAGVILAEMRLFAALILANYDLDGEALGRVLRVDYTPDAPPEAVAMRRALLTVAVGSTPDPVDPAAAPAA